MKLPTNANHVKVPLSALRITGNVRKNFDPEDIERLALSIRQDGLMNPITVRPPVEDENGNKTYEVIAGGRRIRAHQWLCDHGDDFAMIECCVRTGDTWTLQMIENIQRTDLSPREKEEAVAAAMENGLTMTQIAEKLCKPISYVSDIVAGMKVRAAADQAGIATEEISTKALSQLRSIPEESLGGAISDLAESGGTFREATRVLHEYKKPTIEDEGSAFDIDTSNVSSETEEEAIDPFEIEPESTEQELRNDIRPDPFNWYIKNESCMQDALLGLPQKIRKMPLNTEICVQAGSKVAPITSVVYNPDEDRLIFRCLEDFGVMF